MTIAALSGACGDSKDSSADTTATTDATTVTTAASATMEAVTLTAADDNTTKNLSVGQRLVIKLDVNGGTGYSWPVTTAPDAKVLNQLSQTQDKKSAATSEGGAPMVGTPETVTTTFEAVGAGQTKIVLSLTPPGSGRAAEDTFTVTVIVS